MYNQLPSDPPTVSRDDVRDVVLGIGMTVKGRGGGIRLAKSPKDASRFSVIWVSDLGLSLRLRKTEVKGGLQGTTSMNSVGS